MQLSATRTLARAPAEGRHRVPLLNVIEEFQAEKAEIESLHKGYVLSFGDYIAKTFLGPTDKDLDALDRPGACCVIA